MCILADSLLEEFFEADLTNSWRLEVLIAEEKPKQAGATAAVGGWWGGIVSAVMTDENKVSRRLRLTSHCADRFRVAQERLNRLADEVGKRLDIQTIEHRPSIGKLDAAAAAIEPTARDSLFSTSNRPPKTAPAVAEVANPLSAAAMRMPAYPAVSNPWADAPSKSSSSSPTPARHEIDVQAAASQALNREQFVIDDVADGDEEDYAGGEGDAELMNQVEKMLDEEGGLTGNEAQVGQGEHCLMWSSDLDADLDASQNCSVKVVRVFCSASYRFLQGSSVNSFSPPRRFS